MGRIWALAGGLLLSLLILLILGPLGGAELQLTSALCVGAGAAAAYLWSPSHMLARGLWLLHLLPPGGYLANGLPASVF